VNQRRAAARVVLAAVVLGLLGALLWGLLAPGEQFVVVGDDRGVPLTGESMHVFDAVAIFVLITGVTGLLTAVGAWRLARPRGPILFGGVLLGTVVATLTTAVFGEAVARLRFPRPDSLELHQIVTVAPGIGTVVALGVAPVVASAAILVLAAIDPRDDLGAPAAAAAVGAP